MPSRDHTGESSFVGRNPPGQPLDDGAGSGNFQLAAPVLGLPGRGIDIALGLAYHSRVWNKAGTAINFDIDRDWPAPGWSLGFGKLVGAGSGGSTLIDARHALKDITQLSSVTASGVSTESTSTESTSTESYVYDPEGRVSDQTVTLASRPNYPWWTTTSYDSLDRATDVTYPAEYGNGPLQPRKVVHHDYDVASRLTSLTVNGTAHASQIVYNASSQTTSLKVGPSGANQITENYAYNSQTGLLDNQTVARGATTLLDLSYDYANANGKRTGQLTKILNNLNHNPGMQLSISVLKQPTATSSWRATAGPASSWGLGPGVMAISLSRCTIRSPSSSNVPEIEFISITLLVNDGEL